MIIRMIIINMHFDGGSAEEEHDIAHIASSIIARLYGGLFLSFGVEGAEREGGGIHYKSRLSQKGAAVRNTGTE